ncbi:hypothetical protein PPERSA_02249 [Pseudocohnilembus persalinus]|uniref:Apple domain-containing protein n=1 Tax=Pseudocohnilembus persalinus TaxID=266149 RepID=A0A0V0QKK3_PSEPJ|nr:hypothetical protein PPERSA_02249 [Pseudocohnilembus persalinus]|eukprot:KRX02759.1 hypothetical protein PPERSA_02249 [Pseudocohnilembus persalinus]
MSKLLNIFLILALLNLAFASDLTVTVEEYEECKDTCENDGEGSDAATENFYKFYDEDEKCVKYNEIFVDLDGEDNFPAQEYADCINDWNAQANTGNKGFNDYITCNCECANAECSFGGVIGFALAAFVGVLSVLL